MSAPAWYCRARESGACVWVPESYSRARMPEGATLRMAHVPACSVTATQAESAIGLATAPRAGRGMWCGDARVEKTRDELALLLRVVRRERQGAPLARWSLARLAEKCARYAART